MMRAKEKKEVVSVVMKKELAEELMRLGLHWLREAAEVVAGERDSRLCLEYRLCSI